MTFGAGRLGLIRRSRSSRAHAVLLGAVAIAAVVVLAQACANPVDRRQETTSAATHVHALAPNAQGDAVLAGTHHGVVEVQFDGNRAPVRVSDYAHDFMGLTSDGATRLLGSGHPDLTSDLDPPHLGLVESEDSGKVWQAVSLRGEVDFHALAATGERVYGSDASSQRLLRSDDGGGMWTELDPPEPLSSLAVDPSNPERLVASSDSTLYFSDDGGGSFERLEQLGGALAWSTTGAAALVERGTGRVLRSVDGRQWRLTGTAPFADTVAITAIDDERLAAVSGSGALAVSSDGGGTWKGIAVLDEPSE